MRLRYNLIFIFRFRLSRRFSFKIPFAVRFAQRSTIERFAILRQKEDLSLILNNFLRKGGWMGSRIGWVSNSQQPPRGETWEIIIIYYIIHNRICDTIINFIANNMS